MWYPIPVISALETLRQEDAKLKNSFVYSVGPCLKERIRQNLKELNFCDYQVLKHLSEQSKIRTDEQRDTPIQRKDKCPGRHLHEEILLLMLKSSLKIDIF